MLFLKKKYKKPNNCPLLFFDVIAKNVTNGTGFYHQQPFEH